ncbi:MAG: stage II sporulation protein R [Bacillota bacterium]|nr:stage II sporulation protein R [Bacillota bacterium]
MKKGILIFICILIIFVIADNSNLVNGSSLSNKVSEQSSTNIQKSISKKIIRFHVIANSDTDEDQALKLKVRDNVLAYITPKLKNSKSIEESRKILLKNDAEINKIAVSTVKNNGYKYTVKTQLSNENFPIKSYGNITLPQGNYEAYRIIIGSGEGHNWWCVMFPPLCFIDITKGEVSNQQTEKEMKQVLTDKEFSAVDNSSKNDIDTHSSNENKTSKDNKIQVKFKVVEVIKKVFKH